MLDDSTTPRDQPAAEPPPAEAAAAQPAPHPRL